MTEKTLTSEIADHFCRLRYEDLPDKVVEKVKAFALHGIGVGLAAVRMPTAEQARRVVLKMHSPAPVGARLVGEGTRVGIARAAFANSVLFHSRLQEDDYHDGMIHLGVVVLPAALATAERYQKSGKEFITAVAAGYEIGARISRVFSRSSISRGFRSTPLYGPIAASVASGKLLDLEAGQLADAIGWAANCGGGLLECGIAQTISEMPFQAGFACSNGVASAMLASEGGVAAPTLLEGERGFLRAHAGTTEGAGMITSGLGERYFMLDTFFKHYPVGGLLQAPVSAMLRLVGERAIEPHSIQSAELRMSSEEAEYPGANSMKPGPMNLRYCLAYAACVGDVTTAVISGAADSRILSLMSKISIVADETITPLECRLAVATDDATYQRASRVGVTSLDEEAEFVRSLVREMTISSRKAGAAIDMILGLESCPNIRGLVDLLVPEGEE